MFGEISAQLHHNSIEGTEKLKKCNEKKISREIRANDIVLWEGRKKR